MRENIGLLSIVGFVAVLATAQAQTPPPSPITAFDGTYAFVSVTKLKETYTDFVGRLKRCGEDRGVGPLIIKNGWARYLRDQAQHEGTVGSQGELLLRLAPAPSLNPNLPGTEVIVLARIDGTGMVHARQTGQWCQYDLVWQKLSK